jgi:hypothetical protein
VLSEAGAAADDPGAEPAVGTADAAADPEADPAGKSSAD